MEVHVEVAAETLFHIGPIPVTNSMLTMFIVMAGLIIVGNLLARKAKLVPGRGQGIFEMVVEFMLGIVEGTAGRRAGRTIFPLIAGLFIFIIVANYSGLLPGVGTIGYWKDEEVAAEASTTTLVTEQAAVQSDAVYQTESAEETHHEKVLIPFFRSPSADLNMTLAMAFVSFFAFQIAGLRAHGVKGRIKHMADPWWIFPLELIQELARVISLSFRLFGNIFAGEVLLTVMYAMANAIKIAIIPFVFPVIFIFLEILFGFIQALVFALLSLAYIALATAGGHDDEEEHSQTHEIESEPAAPVPAGVGD